MYHGFTNITISEMTVARCICHFFPSIDFVILTDTTKEDIHAEELIWMYA